MEHDEVFTLEEAAAFLKVSPVTARQFATMGYLRVARTAGNRGRILVLKSECIAAVRKLMETPVPPLPKILTGNVAGTDTGEQYPGEAERRLKERLEELTSRNRKTKPAPSR